MGDLQLLEITHLCWMRTGEELGKRARVGEALGAVSGLLPVRFPRPPTEPADRVSTQRALRTSCPMLGRCRGSG